MSDDRPVTFRDVFAVSEYRSVWFALVASWIGDYLARAAVVVLVFQQTSSVTWSAAAFAVSYLPWLLFGLFAGAVADHRDRRLLVMIANGAQGVIVLALVVFIVTGHANVWIVLATAFLYGTAEVFADTAGTTLLAIPSTAVARP